MTKKILFAAAAILAFSGVARAQTEEQLAAVIAAMPVHAGEAAPDFTLKDTEGKDVSLSQFKGNWVVLDFWGTWCRFCIQGMPAMKVYYEKFHPMGLEVIGIDCGDPQETWLAGVERLQLPWVNLYNPDAKGKGVADLYGIKAYPTKILINPEGNVVEIFLGEDPAFYETIDAIFQ